MTDDADRGRAAVGLSQSFYSWTLGWSVDKNVKLIDVAFREREIAALEEARAMCHRLEMSADLDGAGDFIADKLLVLIEARRK